MNIKLYETKILQAILAYKEYCEEEGMSIDDMETQLLHILDSIGIEFSR